MRQQLPVGVGPDDRMPLGSREPKVRPADRTTLQ
ncbi:serine/threonine protein kinase [Escherichia coli O145:H25 str. 07-3858]|nr:serine/threonine protein kinase [Escherichia coli O145:H25 str. 07-3858]